MMMRKLPLKMVPTARRLLRYGGSRVGFGLPAVTLCLFALSPLHAQLTDAAVEARRLAFRFIGAFTADGFTTRDGFYTGTLQPGKWADIQVTLLAGNTYWLVAAVAESAKSPGLELRTPTGGLVRTHTVFVDGISAIGVTPAISGPHSLRIVSPGNEPCEFSLVYCFK